MQAMAARAASGQRGCEGGVPSARQCLSQGRCVPRTPEALSLINEALSLINEALSLINIDALLRDPDQAFAEEALSASNSRYRTAYCPITYSSISPGSPWR